jgi:dTDP-4-amino-4,6-dideoxygalactose transaminase
MIKFHEPFKAKNTKKYLNKVVKRNSFNDNYFIEGCTEILSEFYQTQNLLLTHSGTAALEISSMLLKEINKNPIQKTVIKLPSYTFSSTANAYLRSNFNISFLDVNTDDMIVNRNEYQKLKENEYLVSVNYANSTFEYPQNYSHKLIEDAAQSFGVTYNKQPVGTFGRYGCVSFHPTKNLHAGYGGLIVVSDVEEFELAKTIWERGTDRNKVINGLKKKYEWVSMGSSFQMTELSAAVLLSQLEASEKIIKLRSEIYKSYIENLKPLIENQTISIQKINPNVSPNYHAFYIIINKEREKFLEYLYNCGIQAYIGYESLHNSSYANSINLNVDLQNTEEITPYLVRLPLHTNLSKKDVIYICRKIKEYLES